MLNMIAGSRPFPVDEERKRRCLAVLASAGMTVPELAMHLGVSRQLVHAVISGRQPSRSVEGRMARFLGVPAEYLFPVRTGAEIAAMRSAEALKKERSRKNKAVRMQIRQNAINAQMQKER